MRPQQNRRVRGRNNNSNGNNNNNNRRGPNPLSRNYESSGPDVKIRGNAQQIADKYISLARDAQGAGDRVMSENYLQHAEHYLRIILAAVGQNSQSAKRDENRDESRDENNEQEYGEINTEGERKDTVSCDTDISQIRAQENGRGQYTKPQNGCAYGEALKAPALLDEESDQEQCAAEESVEPVKKIRRSSRRRTVRAQEKAPLELPGFELSKAALETSQNGEVSQNGDASTEKTASFPVLGEEIQRKPRRRRVATSSAEENV
ncbi:DUF4167 domain-containing protein [Bartonella sp. 220]|uniref:DUF4167 domain-containing protein n=1 Tax=Bartonella sp. 220B TaxID=2967260 RepID=UPI0022A8DF02|nr:DUF4167 domain-containing protein [Bartonella sp. 220B]MCZ2158666.1 DUF4167 domain-containing protein [Bartonella sp. 220B]